MCNNCECSASENSSDKDGRHGRDRKDRSRSHRNDKCDKCHSSKCTSHCDREHTCNCKKHVIDYSRVCNNDDVKIISIVSNVIIVVNGYILNTGSNQECCTAGCQIEDPVGSRFGSRGCNANMPLADGVMIKHSLKMNDCGLVCSNTHTVQIDLGDYIRLKNMKCLDPKITIGGIDKYEKVIIWGSNILGTLGKEIYSYTNTNSNQELEITIPSFDTTNLTKTGDIYIHGSLPFRYISITSCNCNITLHSLSIYLPV